MDKPGCSLLIFGQNVSLTERKKADGRPFRTLGSFFFPFSSPLGEDINFHLPVVAELCHFLPCLRTRTFPWPTWSSIFPEHFLENCEIDWGVGCFFLCPSRQVCTKKRAYGDILPCGLLGYPARCCCGGRRVRLAKDFPQSSAQRSSWPLRCCPGSGRELVRHYVKILPLLFSRKQS